MAYNAVKKILHQCMLEKNSITRGLGRRNSFPNQITHCLSHFSFCQVFRVVPTCSKVFPYVRFQVLEHPICISGPVYMR